MKLIACDPLMGLPRVPPEGYRPDREDLLHEMARIGVDMAIVRHRTACEAGPVAGNTVILDDLRGAGNLLPTWFVTPDGLEPDFDPEQMINDMLAAGVHVCWTDPVAESFSLMPWCSGPLYEVLQARQIPLLLEFAQTTADVLDVILQNFPGLRLILLNVPRMGRHRLIYPLLKRNPSLMLCLNYSYSVHLGIEDLCKTFGNERWVFGMGYPTAEAGASLTGLTYAGISDADKEAIAHGNIERLLAEVRA